MTSFTNAALSTTTVASADVLRILGSHGLNEGDADLVVTVCLECHSISEAPDKATKDYAQKSLDMTCCSGEATIHIP